jgi:polysaccharide biosynthesis protein PslF
MRVAMVTGSYPPQPCGVGDYTERLVNELRRAGVAVDVITTEALDRDGSIPVHYLLPKWTVSNWLRALRWMRKQKYDLIHIQYPARFYGYRPWLGFLSVLAKIALPGTPLVVTLHEFRITHVLRKLTSMMLLGPSAAVVLSADSERVVVDRWMPWLGSRVHVLAMASTVPVVPVSDERWRQLRETRGIALDDTVVAYFGLLHPNKGIDKLLESFAAVHRQVPKTKLVMLSFFEPGANPYHASLAGKAVTLGISESIVWTGYIDNRASSEHLGIADVGFFPFQDGVTLRRLSFMTGMGHGLPTLTTEGHAGTEAIGLRDGENVSIVPVDASVDVLSQRLLALVQDASLRARLAEGAQEWVAPFQWNAIIPKLMAIYDEVLGRTAEVTHSNG